MGSRVNDLPCTGPNRLPMDHYEKQPAQQPQQVQTEPTRMPDEKDKNLTQEKKADLQTTGTIKQSELLATTKTADPKQANKTEAAQQVEKAMEQSRANGGSHRDAVVAGAKADAGHVSLNGAGGVNGEDRLREVYTNTGNQLKPFGQKYENGKPILPTEKGQEKASSWCGIWATDVWKRSGVDAKWTVGRGITNSKGEKYDTVATSGNKDDKLKNVKPGDVIVLNDYKKDAPNKIKDGSTNHHAIVTESVYQVPGKSEKVECPPNPVPENGKLVGFNTMNGNNPTGTESPDACIRKGYVDLTQEPVQADGSTRKISGYYPLPEKK